MTALPLPEGTWDTHVHVFEPDRFPYAAMRSYTPGTASLESLEQRHREWGVGHAVLVQPSVYGDDNGCLLDALRRLGPSARGVAVADAHTLDDNTLAAFSDAGIRGFRVNLMAGRALDPDDALLMMAERLRGTGLFLQIYAPLSAILARASTLEDAGIPVVLDHFAGAGAEDDARSMEHLAALCRSAPIWIKLSGDYRIGASGDVPRTRVLDLIQQFEAMVPDRLIWASDWPHTGGGATRKARSLAETEPFRDVDSLSVPKLMAEAGLDAPACRRILVDNPTALFGANPLSPSPAEHAGPASRAGQRI
ncbi:amidohydrolase family protein [Ancylobacter pratisalsi]|uniref:Amidohydrolase family protein n=1 Tax=Ancylobacter pratisalsi TaxID=1745854 RepID=A0A6P1YMT5_9HYPH|nr:amidohydrolase family protein [Ancylobacter pratisalsi]QIB34629.1 amidohydrolase family protein [Ancylobacter pratisalsi]